jgi:hypothetical protein
LRKLFTIISFIFFAALDCKAQSDSLFRFVGSIKGEYSSFNVDILDNIYLLNKTGQLKKLNERGDSVSVFNDVKKYGNAYSVDVSNPLKTLLYYKNYTTVVMLDRLLGLRNTINFRNQNIFTVQAVSTSYDNNIWLFDDQDFRLKKIDETGKMLQQTNDWRLLFDSVPSPTRIIDRDQFVYLYDPAKGFYIFDYYGSIKNKLPFTGWSDVEVSGRKIYGFQNDIMYSYELNSLDLKTYKLPAFFGEYTAIKTMNGKVYLNKGNRIDIYQVK